MRDYKIELEKRVEFIKSVLKQAHSDGVVFGNSGGKDSALVGILAKKACGENVLGVIMPCVSKQNYNQDKTDADAVAKQFGIKNIIVDVSEMKNALLNELNDNIKITDQSSNNVNPRLRMTTLYAIAQTKNYLVAGTGNKSERTMGYFTKYGDGGCDFNPIGDLTATEVFEFLKFLNAPKSIIEKAPSAGLFEGQTDEKEMGITYKEIDDYILYGKGTQEAIDKIEATKNRTEHKRRMPTVYGE